MAEVVVDKLITKFLFDVDGAALDRLQTRMGNVRSKLNQFSTSLSRLGLVGVGALALIAKKSFAASKSFQNFSAILGASRDTMEELKNLGIQIGSNLPLMTSDIFNAGAALARAGKTVEEIKMLWEPVALLSVASPGVNVEDAADAIRLITDLWGLKTKEQINKVVNQLVLTGMITPGSVRGIVDALPQLAASSAVLGVKPEHLFAAIGQGTAGGAEATEVATLMGNIYKNLGRIFNAADRKQAGENAGRGAGLIPMIRQLVGGKDDEEAISIAKSLLNDTERKYGFMASLFKLLNQKMLDNPSPVNTAKIMGVLSSIGGGGSTGSSSFILLAKELPKLIKVMDLLAEVRPDRAQKFADTLFEGLSGSFIKLMAQIDTLFIRLSEMNTGLISFFDGLTQMITWLVKTDEEGKKVNATWITLIGTLFEWMAILLPLAIFLRLIAFSIGVLIVSTKLWAGALLLVGLAWKLSPFGLIITAITTLITLISYAWYNWESFLNFLTHPVEGILDWFRTDEDIAKRAKELQIKMEASGSAAPPVNSTTTQNSQKTVKVEVGEINVSASTESDAKEIGFEITERLGIVFEQLATSADDGQLA